MNQTTQSKTVEMLGGFDYEVTQEQMDLYAKMNVRQRLMWLEDARLFTLKAQTPETRALQQRLRQGW